MAQTTTNYSLLKPEATDTYNHLVYDNPNMDTIDSVMKNNANHSVDSATCIKSGTVHSVTRTNTSCPVFKFTATGDWNTGDTMDVDGTPVSVFLPNGTAPLTGCYVINTEVLAIISGSRVTLMCPVIPDASDISFDPTGTTLSATNVEAAMVELNDSSHIKYDANNSVKNMLDVTTGIITVKPGVNITIVRSQLYKVGNLKCLTMVYQPGSNINPNTDVFDLPTGFDSTGLNDIISIESTGSAKPLLVTGSKIVTNGVLTSNIYYFVNAIYR